MAARSLIPRLTDIIEAIERINDALGDMPLDAFETDWRNVLRHNYESIAAPVVWKLAQPDLPLLEKVCREELKAKEERERGD
ncbi:MAG: hypothetical protein HYS06_04985 [Methylocystis sp.]|nr:hypothetical protein [Methylocystis sp.]MBI3274780.1 hypothetical protein [Methylocystis sp.]